MTYKEIIDKEESSSKLSEPVMMTYVADAMPQSVDEWMDMAAESEASGWLSEQEFFDHASRWSHM